MPKQFFCARSYYFSKAGGNIKVVETALTCINHLFLNTLAILLSSRQLVCTSKSLGCRF